MNIKDWKQKKWDSFQMWLMFWIGFGISALLTFGSLELNGII